MCLRPTEGAGNAGRLMRPQPCVRIKKAHKHSHHGHTGTPGIPRAMVYGLFRALPGDRAFLPPSSASMPKHRRRFDASIGASGPHGFTVRKRTSLVGRRVHVHRIPRSTLVTMRNAPQIEHRTRGKMPLICPSSQAKVPATHCHDGQITSSLAHVVTTSVKSVDTEATVGFVPQAAQSPHGVETKWKARDGLCSRNVLHGRLGLLSEPVHEQFDAAIADQIGWPLGNLNFRALDCRITGECRHQASRRNRICDQK